MNEEHALIFFEMCKQENEENGEPEIDDEEDDEVDEEDEEEGEGWCNINVHNFLTWRQTNSKTF